MRNENAGGITDVKLIQKYIGKLMDMEVSEFIRRERERPRYAHCVMDVYLRQDVELDFMDDFFQGHCTYAEWLGAVLDAGRAAKREAFGERRRCHEEDYEMVSYGCTGLECYHWALGLIAGALLKYADSSITGQMFCDINMRVLSESR